MERRGILTGWKWVKFQLPAGAYMFFWMLLPQLAGMMEIGVEKGENVEAGIAWYAHAGGFVGGALAMVVFGADAMRKVRMNRDGQWEVHATAIEPAAETKIADEKSIAQEIPAYDGPACQYCRTPLEDSHKMDATLYRCPNPECKRLTYVTAEPETATKSGWWKPPSSLFGTGASRGSQR